MNSPPKSRLILVLGSGGVGKTSTSAALGLALAQRGFRCAVITIDPAKRLAQALKLEALSNDPQRVYEDASSGHQGSLDALWLDSKSAFTELVRRQIKSPELAQKILDNRLFKIIQEQLGGIEEYLSIDRLLRLGSSGDYDICILDTPPSRHALDFIESPRHLLKFFDDSILRIFLKDEDENSSGFFAKIFSGTRHQALEIFKKFLGQKFMGELSTLLSQSRPVHDSLRRTAEAAEAWIKESHNLSILVSLPERYPIEEAYLLSKELLAHEMRKADLLLLNRCLPEMAPEPTQEIETLLGKEAYAHLLDQHQAQTELLRDIQSKIHTYAQNLVRLPRFSNSNMNLSTLRELGKELIRQWETSKPMLFSKN